MKTAVINIKTTPLVKINAQKIAEEMGVALGSLINGFLNTMIKTKRVEFTTLPKEKPTQFMLQALKEARKSPSSPRFTNARDALAWLDNSQRQYAN